MCDIHFELRVVQLVRGGGFSFLGEEERSEIDREVVRRRQMTTTEGRRTKPGGRGSDARERAMKQAETASDYFLSSTTVLPPYSYPFL